MVSPNRVGLGTSINHLDSIRDEDPVLSKETDYICSYETVTRIFCLATLDSYDWMALDQSLH